MFIEQGKYYPSIIFEKLKKTSQNLTKHQGSSYFFLSSCWELFSSVSYCQFKNNERVETTKFYIVFDWDLKKSVYGLFWGEKVISFCCFVGSRVEILKNIIFLSVWKENVFVQFLFIYFIFWIELVTKMPEKIMQDNLAPVFVEKKIYEQK